MAYRPVDTRDDDRDFNTFMLLARCLQPSLCSF